MGCLNFNFDPKSSTGGGGGGGLIHSDVWGVGRRRGFRFDGHLKFSLHESESNASNEEFLSTDLTPFPDDGTALDDVISTGGDGGDSDSDGDFSMDDCSSDASVVEVAIERVGKRGGRRWDVEDDIAFGPIG